MTTSDRFQGPWPAASTEPHKGRHHYAICGNYVPVQGNHECERCPVKCPCGTYYARDWS